MVDRVADLIDNINIRFPVLGTPICITRAMTMTYRDFNYGVVLVGPRASGKTAVMEVGLAGSAQPLSTASVAGFAKAINEDLIEVPEDGHILFKVDDLADIVLYPHRIDAFVTLMSQLMFLGEVAYLMGRDTATIENVWASVVCGGTIESYEKLRKRSDWLAKNVDRFPLRMHLVYKGAEFQLKENLSQVYELMGKHRLVELWTDEGLYIDKTLGITPEKVTKYLSRLRLKRRSGKIIHFKKFRNIIDGYLKKGNMAEVIDLLPQGLIDLVSFIRKYEEASASRLTCVAMSLAIFHAYGNGQIVITDEDFTFWKDYLWRYLAPDKASGVTLMYYYALCEEGNRSFDNYNTITDKERVFVSRLLKMKLVKVKYGKRRTTRYIKSIIPL